MSILELKPKVYRHLKWNRCAFNSIINNREECESVERGHVEPKYHISLPFPQQTFNRIPTKVRPLEIKYECETTRKTKHKQVMSIDWALYKVNVGWWSVGGGPLLPHDSYITKREVFRRHFVEKVPSKLCSTLYLTHRAYSSVDSLNHFGLWWASLSVNQRSFATHWVYLVRH